MTTAAEAPYKPNRTRYVRHWKERFTKGMPLIFLKRTRLDAHRTMEPGMPVSPELRAELGEHRMKMWWAARTLGAPSTLVVNVPEDKTIETAKDKFDNQDKFGGNAPLPRKEEKPKGKKN